jgi:hypothetical protein
VLMEQEANIRLFGERSRGAVYSRINLRALMRGSPKEQSEWYRTMVNAGIMTINEVRELEELNAIGAEGNEHYLQTAMTTVKRIADGENVAATAAPVEAESPAEEPPAEPENVIRRIALDWWKTGGREIANGK